MESDYGSQINERFNEICLVWGVSEPIIEKYSELILSRYSEEHRFYHTLSHIHNLLTLSNEYKDLLRDKEVVDMAILFHDIIYEPSNHDPSNSNEIQSAIVFEEFVNEIQSSFEIKEEEVDDNVVGREEGRRDLEDVRRVVVRFIKQTQFHHDLQKLDEKEIDLSRSSSHKSEDDNISTKLSENNKIQEEEEEVVDDGNQMKKNEEWYSDMLYFLDFDLSIIGSPSPHIYNSYASGIYQEYLPYLPNQAYFCSKRAEFLTRFLENEFLFHSTICQERFEIYARQNLTREIEALNNDIILGI